MYYHCYTEILKPILLSYEKYGYKFLIFTVNDNIEKEKKFINELLSFQVEGLIVLSHTIPSEDLADYVIPIVTIEREDKFVNSVSCNNYIGGKKAAELLNDLNCDILIHINSKTSCEIPASARITGFIDTCEKTIQITKLSIKTLDIILIL